MTILGEIEQLVRISIPPSFFVRETRVYKSWCNVTECPDCGVRGKYEDAHIVNPCFNCGVKVKEKVGRWKLKPRTRKCGNCGLKM